MMEIQVEYIIAILQQRHYKLKQNHNETYNENDVSLNGVIVELCGKHTSVHTLLIASKVMYFATPSQLGIPFPVVHRRATVTI